MDAARARTLWRMLDGRDPAIAVMVLGATKVCALVTEMLWKCSLANRHELCDAPEESNGIIERALMLRMMPIFWAGYRTPLQTEHLSKLDTKLQNAELRPTEKGMLPKTLRHIIVKTLLIASRTQKKTGADQACKRDLLLSHLRVSSPHIPPTMLPLLDLCPTIPRPSSDRLHLETKDRGLWRER